MSNKVLLTGATGYLGSNLLKRLIQENIWDISVVIRRTSNLDGINLLSKSIHTIYDTEINEQLFQENAFHSIIHCATNYGRKGESISDIYQSNLIFPLSILSLANKYGIKKFINTSTALEKHVSSYSLSKKHFEEIAFFLSAKSSLSFINIQVEQFYGPKAPNSLFPSYIINSLMNNTEEIDLTLGNQKRDIIYIDDVIEAYIKILDINFLKGFKNIPIGSGKAISIRDFVETVKTLTNSKTKLNYGIIPYRKNEQMFSEADLTEMKKLGWTPKINLEVGINKCINNKGI